MAMTNDANVETQLTEIVESYVQDKMASPTILLGVCRGSRAKGYATATSDFDLHVVAIRTPDAYLRIKRPTDAYQKVDAGHVTVGGTEVGIEVGIDICLWDATKALTLAERGNPTIVEAVRLARYRGTYQGELADEHSTQLFEDYVLKNARPEVLHRAAKGTLSKYLFGRYANDPSPTRFVKLADALSEALCVICDEAPAPLDINERLDRCERDATTHARRLGCYPAQIVETVGAMRSVIERRGPNEVAEHDAQAIAWLATRVVAHDKMKGRTCAVAGDDAEATFAKLLTRKLTKHKRPLR